MYKSGRKNHFTNHLVRLLLTQSGIYFTDEELTSDPQLPASVGDVLRSEKYWKPKINNYEKTCKSIDQKISTKL